MKKLGIFIAASALTLSLAACGSGASGTTTTAAAAETTAAASAETTAAAGAATELTEISAGMCSTPAILTSIGQSADVDIANTLCTKAGIEVTMNKNITGADLPDDCKTLILAVGGSSKGLGAAGIDADQELARTDALISAAKEKGIIVLALHTGGSARRGTLSDSFITPAFQGCDAADPPDGAGRENKRNLRVRDDRALAVGAPRRGQEYLPVPGERRCDVQLRACV